MQPISSEQRSERGRDAMTHVGPSVSITRVDDFQYQLTYPADRVNHVLHLILSFLTGGLWVVVWVVVILNARRERHSLITVDEYGGVWRDGELWWHPDRTSPIWPL